MSHYPEFSYGEVHNVESCISAIKIFIDYLPLWFVYFMFKMHSLLIIIGVTAQL